MVPLYFLLSMILLFGALLYIAGDLRARPTVACSGTRTHAPTHPRTHAPTHPRTHAPTPRPAATRRTHRPQLTTAARHALMDRASAMPMPCHAPPPQHTTEEQSDFDSIMGSGWFVLVTLTTVGYGDRYPLTSIGQIITSFAIICGVLFTAMPLTIVGNNFAAVWSEKEAIRVVLKMQVRRHATRHESWHGMAKKEKKRPLCSIRMRACVPPHPHTRTPSACAARCVCRRSCCCRAASRRET